MCLDFKVCAITLLYESRVTLIRTKNKFKIQTHGCYHFYETREKSHRRLRKMQCFWDTRAVATGWHWKVMLKWTPRDEDEALPL